MATLEQAIEGARSCAKHFQTIVIVRRSSNGQYMHERKVWRDEQPLSNILYPPERDTHQVHPSGAVVCLRD